jgi:hypothetical protein
MRSHPWTIHVSYASNVATCRQLGENGIVIKVPIVRITAEDGSTGFGCSRATGAVADGPLGRTLADIFIRRRLA